MTVSAAAGYNASAITGSRWDPISYNKSVIGRLMPRAIGNRVAMLETGMNKCGMTESFRHATTGAVHEYEENDHQDPMDLDVPCEVELRIDEGWSYRRKYSTRQYELLQCNDPEFLRDQEQADQEAGTLHMDELIMSEILANAHRMNRGANAGLATKLYNNGSSGNPIEISKETIFRILNNAYSTLEEQNIPMGNGAQAPFLTGPTVLRNIILGNEKLASYFHQGSCLTSCPYISGVMPNQIMGFDIIPNACTKVYKDGRDIIAPIVFGFREATVGKVRFEKRILSDTVPGERDVDVEAWWDFGVKTLDARKIGVIYGKFNVEA